MNTKIHKILALLIILVAIPLALVQGQGDYKIGWSTIYSGGGTSSGGTYSVNRMLPSFDKFMTPSTVP